MIKDKKLSYYNYFLMLSLALIVGYFITSLFFLNRTWQSGKQAEQYGLTVEKTNAIIQHTSQLESAAYSYIITQSNESSAIYLHKKESLLQNVKRLNAHCSAHHFAGDETSTLNYLISQRIDMLDEMMKDTMSSESKKEKMSFGNETTMQILNTLSRIRTVNNEMRELNQRKASVANRNTIMLLTVFGAVMMLIVFISFFIMRKEILRSERYLREINQINLELSSMNENLENFAYVASHDLNEPLRKIRTFGELIEIELNNESVDRKTVVSHIHRMQSAAERMQELIEDLLSYSRISRQFSITEKIDLQKAVQTVLSDLEITIKEHKAEVNIHSLPNSILADEIQMRQLFQNLVSNGIKFKKDNVNPIIDIKSERVTAVELPCAELPKNNPQMYWKISVSDNGIGFDEKYLDKIFGVFQRLHGRSSYEGTGIGLSICKKICENHKGAITANSTEGSGATFVVFLPDNQNK
ncbi:MAG TPA: ATP-binding protein [Brumimicrobium sp.]|nr:ATP-binding protein [Brumimicrobium sp.]